MFGFTGTPIKTAGGDYTATREIFGDELHTYTIVNAIDDKNVLPFRVDYIGTMKAKEDIRD